MLRLPLVLSCCAALAAQQAAPQTSAAPAANRFVPADSCLVVRCGAPAKWQSRFAKTQVAKLLQSATLAPLLAQLRDGIDEAMTELRQSGELDVDLLEALRDDYLGELVASVQIDWDDLPTALLEDRPPAMSAVIALTPGEGIDLAKLATAIGEAVERNTEGRRELRDATVGDLLLRVTADDEEMAVSVPALVDGHLVMVFTTGEFEAVAARLLGTDDRYEGDLGSAPLFVEGRLAAAMSTVMELIADDAGAAPVDVMAVLEGMGIDALDRMHMSVDADQRHVVAEWEVSLRSDAEGLMQAFFTEHRPQLLRLVPPGTELFSTTVFDVGGLWRGVRDIWQELGDGVPLAYDQAMQMFAEATKVRLDDDLIAHLGREMLMLDDLDPEADAMEDEDMAGSMLAGSCIAVALRDGKAFAQSVETLLRSRGLHAARKSEDYAGTKVYRLVVAGIVEIEYAITDDLLLLVIGEREGARRNLRAVLDARAAGATEPSLPDAVQAHLQALPPGFSSLGVTPIGQVLEGLGQMVETGLAMEGFSLEDFEDGELDWMPLLTAIGADIQRLGIDHMVGASYASRRSLRSVIRW